MVGLFVCLAAVTAANATQPSAPGHWSQPAPPSAAAAKLASNAALIANLERTTRAGSNRISILGRQIEAARIARGMRPGSPPPPPPPPPYMELATVAQQTAYIAELRSELLRQNDVIPKLERTLRRWRRR
jgi:hypothetical protein